MKVEPCPVCDGKPRVLVVMQHPAMLRFTREILERECGCWVATEVRTGPALAAALDRLTPDLLVIDAADFPACCFAALAHIPRDRVIVIGPEPDPAYREAALGNGAGGWLSREDVADNLSSEMRRVLGCRHDPCPPGHRCRRHGALQPVGHHQLGAAQAPPHREPRAMSALRTTWPAQVVMWTFIGLSIALLGVLLALGWGDDAWATAAGVLLLACVTVCVFAGLQNRSTDREVRRAFARLSAARQEDERRRAPREETAHG